MFHCTVIHYLYAIFGVCIILTLLINFVDYLHSYVFAFTYIIYICLNVGLCVGGQCQWVPSEDGDVVFVGWENKPRKLGLVYCPTRR